MELCEGRARTGFGHFLESEVERISEDGREEQRTILVFLAAFEMRERACEIGPAIDFEQ